LYVQSERDIHTRSLKKKAPQNERDGKREKEKEEGTIGVAAGTKKEILWVFMSMCVEERERESLSLFTLTLTHTRLVRAPGTKKEILWGFMSMCVCVCCV